MFPSSFLEKQQISGALTMDKVGLRENEEAEVKLKKWKYSGQVKWEDTAFAVEIAVILGIWWGINLISVIWLLKHNVSVSGDDIVTTRVSPS